MAKSYIHFCYSTLAFATCLLSSKLQAQEQPAAKPLVSSLEQLIISTPPDSLHYPKFYEKYTDAFGIPVVSSAKVSNVALLVARDVINYMLLKRPDIRKAMISMKARLSIMAWSEMQTDLPEYSNWKKPALSDGRLTPIERENYNKPGGIASMTDKGYWNQRARGMGGIQTSAAEENILGFPGTKYYGENILVHEWSHNVMSALRVADPELYKQIQVAYDAAKQKGLYKGQYAINTVAEYWAEGSQWWFWSNYEFIDGNTRVQTPDDLKAYDPALYNILAQVYPGHHIPGDVYYGKNIPFAKPVLK
ncbi:glycoside hydrolase [Pedobacter rhizosphaerae]|uniref:Glycoside hydrolase n=1 Tax=Pedobacter rhizosphaerae TaxID=390241 RepID=A0A1H9MSJ3_9SPHI|nr:glycoside hydrolase [Pedobacter rhizosphaerae]SER26449.1 hypothetical protein SAMN04488023_106117 [Pedobacter rhizosphaerae]